MGDSIQKFQESPGEFFSERFFAGVRLLEKTDS